MGDGLGYGLFAALMWGLTDICAALAARRFGGLRTAAVVQLTSLGGLYAFALVTQGGLDFRSSVVLESVAVGLIAAVSYLTFYVALKLGPIAVVSPVGSAYGAVAVVLSVALLGERLTAAQAVGAVLATAGVLLVSIRLGSGPRSARFVGPGIPFVVVALVAWGLMTVGIAALVREAESMPVLLVVRTTNAVAIWAVLGGALLRERPGWARLARTSPSAVGLALTAGCLDIAGYVAYATGLQVGLAWLVGLSSSFGPAVAFLFAVAFLGDRLRPIQWLGLAALAVGLALVAMP